MRAATRALVATVEKNRIIRLTIISNEKLHRRHDMRHNEAIVELCEVSTVRVNLRR
jgi:hypothetical protein